MKVVGCVSDFTFTSAQRAVQMWNNALQTLHWRLTFQPFLCAHCSHMHEGEGAAPLRASVQRGGVGGAIKHFSLQTLEGSRSVTAHPERRQNAGVPCFIIIFVLAGRQIWRLADPNQKPRDFISKRGRVGDSQGTRTDRLCEFRKCLIIFLGITRALYVCCHVCANAHSCGATSHTKLSRLFILNVHSKLWPQTDKKKTQEQLSKFNLIENNPEKQF